MRSQADINVMLGTKWKTCLLKPHHELAINKLKGYYFLKGLRMPFLWFYFPQMYLKIRNMAFVKIISCLLATFLTPKHPSFKT